MNNRDIGRRVRELRKKQGLTLAELGDRVGLSQGQLSRLESGKQGFRSALLLRLAKALDVKPVYFFLEQEAERVEESPPPYGLLAGGKLTGALRSAEFVQLAEQLADAYLNRKQAFAAVKAAATIVLGESRTQTRTARKSAGRGPRGPAGASPARRQRKR